MTWIPEIAEFDDEQLSIFEQISNDKTNSWWIKGYAGTGKTMLLAHLAYKLFDEGVNCAYVTYTHALKNLVTEALTEVSEYETTVPVFTVDSLNAIGDGYEVILVDEVQDLQEKQITKLLKLGDRFIFAGDMNQSIFLNAAKPEKINRLLGNPKIVELRDIHRLPEAISFAAHLIYSEAQAADNALVDKIENSTVNTIEARSKLKEVTWVYDQALRESRQGKPSAIIFSKHSEIQEFVELLSEAKLNTSPPAVGRMEDSNSLDYNPINRFLKKNGLSLMYFGGTGGAELSLATKSKAVLMMTMHSAKGLEFDSVFMPFMDSARVICPYPPYKNKDDWQRKFFYITVTRTHLNFYATYTGEPSQYLELLDDENLENYRIHRNI